MVLKTEPMIIKMVSAEMRPKQEYDKANKKWVSTGEEEKYFEYACVTDDLVGEKVIFNSKVDYSKLEGKKVCANVRWEYNNFQKKMGGLVLVDFTESETKPQGEKSK